MAKVNMTPEELVGNIVGNKSEKVQPEKKNANKPVAKKRANALKDPTTFSIVLSSETYQKLQFHVAQEKGEGNRNASVSGCIRSIVEDWVSKNLK